MTNTWETIAIISRLIFIVSFLLVIIGSFGWIGSLVSPELQQKKQMFLRLAVIGGVILVIDYIAALVLGYFAGPTIDGFVDFVPAY